MKVMHTNTLQSIESFRDVIVKLEPLEEPIVKASNRKVLETSRSQASTANRGRKSQRISRNKVDVRYLENMTSEVNVTSDNIKEPDFVKKTFSVDEPAVKMENSERKIRCTRTSSKRIGHVASADETPSKKLREHLKIVASPSRSKRSSSQTGESIADAVGSRKRTKSNLAETLDSPCQSLGKRQSHRHTLSTPRHCVMFTGFDKEPDENTMKNLGCTIVESPSQATVLVTGHVKRTCKLLAAMGRGIPIVSPSWLARAQLYGAFDDPWKYILKDKEAEKKFDFTLRESLKAASHKRLFDGLVFYVTPSVKPSPDEFKGIIEFAGGVCLEVCSRGSIPSFVVSCADDKRQWRSLRKPGVVIVSSEFVLTGLLQQKLSVEKFRLA